MMELDIQGDKIQGEFDVIPNLSEDLILGTPVLEDEGVHLDYDGTCLYVGRKRRKTVYWNQEFKKTLRTLTYKKTQKNWDRYVHKVLQVLRTRQNAATKMTPSRALLGYELPQLGEWKIRGYQEEGEAQGEQPPEERRREIAENQAGYQGRYSPHGATPPVTFQEDDQVMVKVLRKRQDVFLPTWTGPHTVTKKASAEVYEVKRGQNRYLFHVDDLRPTPEGNQLVEVETESESDNDDDDESDDEVRRPVQPEPDQPERDPDDDYEMAEIEPEIIQYPIK